MRGEKHSLSAEVEMGTMRSAYFAPSYAVLLQHPKILIDMSVKVLTLDKQIPDGPICYKFCSADLFVLYSANCRVFP